MFLITSLAIANEVVRPRLASQLPLGTRTDIGYRVTSAKVVIFNRIALERDFPNLRGLSDQTIKNWILDNFAYVNAHQLPLTGIRNTRIKFDKTKTKSLYIPPGVGRGAVIETDQGLVDIKASGNSSWNLEQVQSLVAEAGSSPEGLLKVRERDHSNGLETYYLATAEYLRQLEIQNDYNLRNKASGSDYQTVESYFLIDYGFNLIYPEGEIPAFQYGRQAHFGRLANDKPLLDEIYRDKGKFQETYTGSRIDFGGSRTNNELSEPYHEQMKKFKPADAASFIEEISKSFINRPVSSDFKPVPSSSAREILVNHYRQLERPPRPAAIGRSQLDMRAGWFVDDPRVARIKWTISQLSPIKRRNYLKKMGDEALINLFYLSQNDFQIPLPADSYLWALQSESIRQAAATAAVRVFDRYPHLQEPVIEFALRELESERDSWAPIVVMKLIETNFTFKNADAFIMRALNIGNGIATRHIIHQLSKDTQHPDRIKRTLEWIKNHNIDKDVHEEAKLWFPHLMAIGSCRRIFTD